MIDKELIEQTLAEAVKNGGDFAEVFVEDKQSSSAYFDDGKVEELTSGRDRGAGIRVVVGETTGFAHTADLTQQGLLAAARSASVAAQSKGKQTKVKKLTNAPTPSPSPNPVLMLP